MSRLRLPLLALMAGLLTFGLIALVHTLRRPAVPATATALPAVEAPPAPAPPAGPTWQQHTIQSGETIGSILIAQGLPVQPVLEAALPFHNLRSIRLGRELDFLVDPTTAQTTAMRYPLDEDHTLMIETDGDQWAARVDEIIYQHHVSTRTLTVVSSLWKAATEAGLRPRDIAALAQVFQYDIDFNTEVRAGAQAHMVIEELWKDGEFAKLGAPLAVRFQNQDKQYLAIRYEDSEGKVSYYDQDGTSRKKAFLRSPIEFSRVTSGFAPRRYHPILKKRRPHYGTDFGAPAGTPVRAIGEGVVTWAGRNGGHGNFVKIDHPGPYESSYSHLSRIRVKKGQRVQQGQVIGNVGMTGLATGPHLHFQFWVNHHYVDPLKVELPREHKIPAAELPQFVKQRDTLLSQLDGIADAN